MKHVVRLSLGTALLLAMGCNGLDPLGVREVTFELAPVTTEVSGLPGPESTLYDGATGTLTVDPLDGHGELVCSGLPPLESGTEYEVAIVVAANERDLMPGARPAHDEAAGAGGHDEGTADEGAGHDEAGAADEGGGDHDETPSDGTMNIHVVFDFEEHGCELNFGPSDMNGMSMGAIRRLNISLKAADGDEHLVLTGGVDNNLQVEGGGGHEHGG